MSEPFAKPNREQIEKARELYGDPLLYWATNTSIKALKDMKENPTDFPREFFHRWEMQTRLMVMNFPLVFVVQKVYDIAEEVANKDYPKNFEIPKLIDKTRKVKWENGKFFGETITEVAKSYGLKVKKNKAICPFHNDKDPSLSLCDDKGVFYCFGCQAKGDIIKFIQMLEDVRKNK